MMAALHYQTPFLFSVKDSLNNEYQGESAFYFKRPGNLPIVKSHAQLGGSYFLRCGGQSVHTKRGAEFTCLRTSFTELALA